MGEDRERVSGSRFLRHFEVGEGPVPPFRPYRSFAIDIAQIEGGCQVLIGVHPVAVFDRYRGGPGQWGRGHVWAW